MHTADALLVSGAPLLATASVSLEDGSGAEAESVERAMESSAERLRASSGNGVHDVGRRHFCE